MSKEQQAESKQQKAQRPSPTVESAPLAESLLAFPGSLAPGGLPDHATARPWRQQHILHLQKRHGNHFVQRHLADELVARQDEEEEVEAPPMSAAVLAFEEEIEGYAAPDGLVQLQPDGGANTATINLTVNPPNVVRKPEKDIASAHGRSEIAGWTSSQLRSSATPPTAHSITINLTLNFTMELASEYSGVPLQILQDHENGHVKIATRLAEDLKDNLKFDLEALPDFTATNEVKASEIVRRITQDYVSDDRKEQDAFDTADYHRMTQAYLGSKTPLADLEAQSPAIKGMADALRGFKAAVDLGTLIQYMAQQVVQAGQGLSADDLARLQYNPEFKALVGSCQRDVRWMVDMGDALGSYLFDLMTEVDNTLMRFTWAAP